MSRKLYEQICEKITEFNKYIEHNLADIGFDMSCIKSKTSDILVKLADIPELSKAQKTIESQQRTIEQLTNALRDKYEHGLFIFSEDGKIPMVIRNGKEITNELTSYFGIDWNIGEIPVLNIEQRAGTYHDLEV